MQTQKKTIESAVTEIAQKIFTCIEELGGLIDPNIVTRVLIGDDKPAIVRWGVMRLPTYGNLADYRPRDLTSLIEELIESDYLEEQLVNDTTLLVSLGEKAYQAMQKPDEEIDLLHSETKVKKVFDRKLFEKLRIWRLETAQKKRISAFCILWNQHLTAIVLHQPSTLKELAECEGMGPKRMAEYGSQILDVINEHLSEQ
jgi:ATP-dependent DNA helicase RecQ